MCTTHIAHTNLAPQCAIGLLKRTLILTLTISIIYNSLRFSGHWWSIVEYSARTETQIVEEIVPFAGKLGKRILPLDVFERIDILLAQSVCVESVTSTDRYTTSIAFALFTGIQGLHGLSLGKWSSCSYLATGFGPDMSSSASGSAA